MLQQEVELNRGLSEVTDNNNRGTRGLGLRVALLVELAEACPDTELLAVLNGQKVDIVLVAKSLNETLVCGLIAAVREDAQVGILAVEGLDGLAQTASQTVVLEGLLQNSLQSLQVIQSFLGLSNWGGGGGGISERK